MRLVLSAFIFAAAGFAYLRYHEAPADSNPLGDFLSSEELPIDPEVQIEQLAEAGDEIVAVKGPQVVDFAEIFRFDLTPNHIMDRWEQVSASLRHLDLHGYRVPLVTGIEQTDLAGSLTYYFDTRQQLRRITFVGTTANPLRLSQFMMNQYGFRRVVNNDPRRESYTGGQAVRGYLSIAPSELIDRNSSTMNFTIELRMER